MSGIPPINTQHFFYSENAHLDTQETTQSSVVPTESTTSLPRRTSYPSTASQLSALSSPSRKVSVNSDFRATMPDGTTIRLMEKTDSSLQDGKFLFHDPKLKRADKTGVIEFDAEITSGCVNLKNIFNNSKKKNALDIVIWHLTKNRAQQEFKITGIANDDLYAICKEKYEMENTADEEMSGNLSVVRECAQKRLLDKGWNLD